MKLKKIAALLTVAGFAAPAFATNGMNMEGYGPVSTAMGGTSMAYDNGTAGLINNPATLGLMKSGTSRFDIAVGALSPEITTSMTGATANAEKVSYYMPAVGYVRKDGAITWGAGMMAQGGMGTEYGKNSFLSGFSSMVLGTAGASGVEARSELGIGRVMFPLAIDVSDSVRIGGTFDYLWGGLDMSMPVAGTTFAAMLGGGQVTGSMVNAIGGMMHQDLTGGPACVGACITDIDYAAFSVSEGTNKMKQKMTTSGTAVNLGFTWKASPQLSIGGVYHGKTNLSDMSGNGQMLMQVRIGADSGPGTVGADALASATVPMTVNGKYKVIDFQWPETYGLGFSYQATPELQIAADYKRIRWSETMKNFRIQFTASDTGFAGTTMVATMPMLWDDQNVVQLGAAYKMSSTTTLRVGASFANNPVTSANMNPLFPAIMKEHYTAGMGFAMSKASSLDFSVALAPKVTVTNAAGVSTSMDQFNWQAMYSHRF